MDKQQMLTKIYEVIADKTLSFGVKVNIKYRTDQEGGYMIGTYIPSQKKIEGAICTDIGNKFNGFWYPKKSDCEIIGHQVMIGDVLDWLRDNIEELGHSNVYEHVIKLAYRTEINSWKKSRLPIDTQSDECIKYVYDLLPKSPNG